MLQAVLEELLLVCWLVDKHIRGTLVAILQEQLATLLILMQSDCQNCQLVEVESETTLEDKPHEGLVIWFMKRSIQSLYNIICIVQLLG